MQASKVFDKKYETLEVEVVKDVIYHIKFTREKVLNAMNVKFFDELFQVFEDIKGYEVRVVIISGNGKHFTAGLDLNDAMSTIFQTEEPDPARRSIRLVGIIERLQASISAIAKCNVPVIAAVHGYCIGGGVDLISACDIRLCDESSKFTIKEIDIGMAADIGTLQRLPLIIGNDSFLREAAFTGRIFGSDEASKQGLVSQVYKNREELLVGALKLAETIASKSPVAVWAIKKTLNKNRETLVNDGLEYIRSINMSLLFSNDMSQAVQAGFAKKIPIFPKL